MSKIDQGALDQLFFKARTANGFIDKPVPEALLREAYDIAKMGATSMNTQPRAMYSSLRHRPDRGCCPP